MTRRAPPWIAAAAMLLVLSACSGQMGGPAATLEKVIDAYVAGDREAMAAIANVVETAEEAAKALPEWDTSCSAEAVNARQAILTAALVEGLDQSTIMSMSELARLGNLEAVAKGRGKMTIDLPPEPDCDKRNQIGAVQNVVGRVLLLRTLTRRTEAWRGELQAKYGAEYKLRRKEADRLLNRHGYSSGDGSSW